MGVREAESVDLPPWKVVGDVQLQLDWKRYEAWRRPWFVNVGHFDVNVDVSPQPRSEQVYKDFKRAAVVCALDDVRLRMERTRCIAKPSLVMGLLQCNALFNTSPLLNATSIR